jgi:hypothetical protein
VFSNILDVFVLKEAKKSLLRGEFFLEEGHIENFKTSRKNFYGDFKNVNSD